MSAGGERGRDYTAVMLGRWSAVEIQASVFPKSDDVLTWTDAFPEIGPNHKPYLKQFSRKTIAVAKQNARLVFDRRAFRSAVPKAMPSTFLVVIEQIILNGFLAVGQHDWYLARFRAERARTKKAQSVARLLRSLGHDDLAAIVLERDARQVKTASVSIIPHRKGRRTKHVLVYMLDLLIGEGCKEVTDAERHRLVAAIASPFSEKKLTTERVRELTKNRDRIKRERPR